MPVLTAETKNLWRDFVGAEDLWYCYACGACISGCPASNACWISGLTLKSIIPITNENTPKLSFSHPCEGYA